jgi:tetratricopeptide (TPR) repeat protein
MHRSFLFLTAALIGANAALVQPVTAAQSSVEVGRIAKAITVEIKQVGSDRVGSGILLQKQGAVYTLLTAGHVVKSGKSFTLKTTDGQVHKSITGSVSFSGNNIDLAVLKFRSNNNYTLAKIGTSNSLEPGFPVYVAGFPKPTRTIEAGTFNFTKGEVIGIATRGNEDGYSLIYSNITFKGMSGGAVLNASGELVAIHGQGDRDDTADGRAGEGEKTGRNLGIVVERFATVASAMGLKLDQRVATLPQNQALNASDYFLRGKDKYFRLNNYLGALADYNQALALDPRLPDAYNGRGIIKFKNLNDLQGALADYNQALTLDPKFFKAHNNRANLKVEKLNDIQGALNDYNQAILINPKFSNAYYNRAILKYRNLNDIQGALNDYNQAILINPKYHNAYTNRGNLKVEKLNDIQGALADYNQSIKIIPENPNAYNNRANLKKNKLNDRVGAIQDFRQAARLYKEQGNTQYYQLAIEQLQRLEAIK